jgi:hypothetical protein
VRSSSFGAGGAAPRARSVDAAHQKHLSVYLQDHFAGATAGAGHARRAAGSNRDGEG